MAACPVSPCPSVCPQELILGLPLHQAGRVLYPAVCPLGSLSLSREGVWEASNRPHSSGNKPSLTPAQPLETRTLRTPGVTCKSHLSSFLMAPCVPRRRLGSYTNSCGVEECFLCGRHCVTLFPPVISLSLHNSSLSSMPQFTAFGHLRLREAWEVAQSCTAGKW